jgi:hypothetical protein
MKKLLSWILCFSFPLLGPLTAYAEDTEKFMLAGEYVFDCSYVNFAWGYILRGFYIDKNGNIFKYKREKDPWGRRVISKGQFVVIRKTVLEDKYRNVQHVGKLDLELLKKKIKLIIPASKGKLLRKHRAYDAGSKGCEAFLYDTNGKNILAVNLGTIGIADWEEKNISKEAESLLKWLQDIEKEFITPLNSSPQPAYSPSQPPQLSP